MSEKLCPCCGNRKGCDCYSRQSPQFRRIADLEAVLADEARADAEVQTIVGKYMEDAKQAGRERDDARAIQAAEKKILLAEIEANAETKRELAEERARADHLIQNSGWRCYDDPRTAIDNWRRRIHEMPNL